MQEVSNQRSETKKISKRQERIASIEGEVGIDGRTLKGNIRFSPNGSMQWQDGGDWSK